MRQHCLWLFSSGTSVRSYVRLRGDLRRIRTQPWQCIFFFSRLLLLCLFRVSSSLEVGIWIPRGRLTMTISHLSGSLSSVFFFFVLFCSLLT